MRRITLPVIALLLAGVAGGAFAQQQGTVEGAEPEATQDMPTLRGFSIVKKRDPAAPAPAAPAARPAPAQSVQSSAQSSAQQASGGGSGRSAAARLTRPDFEADGTVRVPAFELPPSPFLSPQGLAAQKARSRFPVSTPANDEPIAEARARIETMMASSVARMRAVHAVTIEPKVIGGVSTRVVTPAGKAADRGRVLINLHGGAFSLCADACAMLESIPIAAMGAFRVVTVNYRMGPEARHPAALEDVTAVYRELLKSYKPRQIGIYGCSAGGALTGQMGAWLPARGLPQPGALGIFGAGGVRFMAGDSAWIAGNIDGSFPPPDKARGDMTRGYFDGADLQDAVLSPALHPATIAKFPPTMLITGTRAMDMTPAVVTNSALIKAGVRSTLIVGEGMGHCYIYQPDLPEARDAQQAIVNFFRENLR